MRTCPDRHLVLSMQVLSRDSVTVSVDAVVYYRVKNPIMATNNVEDYRLASLINQTKNTI